MAVTDFGVLYLALDTTLIKVVLLRTATHCLLLGWDGGVLKLFFDRGVQPKV